MGADAIGCVFYPGSRRAVSLEVAEDISRGVSGLGMMVGLFVNQSAEDIQSILDRVPLHALQFHGGESEAFCRQFNRPYIKAIPMSGDINLADEHLAYASATALLLDSVHAGQFGARLEPASDTGGWALEYERCGCDRSGATRCSGCEQRR